jgi:hypothetical protein
MRIVVVGIGAIGAIGENAGLHIKRAGKDIEIGVPALTHANVYAAVRRCESGAAARALTSIRG